MCESRGMEARTRGLGGVGAQDELCLSVHQSQRRPSESASLGAKPTLPLSGGRPCASFLLSEMAELLLARIRQDAGACVVTGTWSCLINVILSKTEEVIRWSSKDTCPRQQIRLGLGLAAVGTADRLQVCERQGPGPASLPSSWVGRSGLLGPRTLPGSCVSSGTLPASAAPWADPVPGPELPGACAYV